MPEQRTTKVFFSYSHKDRAFVGRIVDAFQAHDDIEVFLDTEDILPTEEWKNRLAQLIEAADTVVFALSPHSAKSEVCAWEVEHANNLNKRIAPIVIKNVEAGEVPPTLAKLNHVFFTNRREFDRSIENLIRALYTDIEWIREHTRLGELARRWDDRGRLSAHALRGSELAAAENWVAVQPANAPQPAPLHHAFVQSSRIAATRRQRLTVGGAISAAVVAALLAGYAMLQQQTAEENARIATQERDRAVAAEQLAEERAAAELQARQEAGAALRAATETANKLVFDIARELRDSGVPSATIVRILKEARQLQETLIGENPDDEVLLHSKAVALDQIAKTLLLQVDMEAAAAAASQSEAIVRKLLQRDSERAHWQLSHSESLLTLGDIRVALGDHPGARDAFQEGLEIARELVERSTDNDTDKNRWRLHLSVHLNRAGGMLVEADDWPGALDAFKESLEITSDLVGSDTKNLHWQRSLSVCLNHLGDMRALERDHAGALALFERSRDIRRDLVSKIEENTTWWHDLSVSLHKVGSMKLEVEDHPGAHEAFRESLEIRRTLAGRDPNNITWQSNLYVSLQAIAGLDVAESPAARRDATAIIDRLRKKGLLAAALKASPELDQTESGDEAKSKSE